ncbi:hypothetical protein A3H16_00255 [Candidatus Kaiserbacteria bacterium RIFCSPLOWO2_12_FULL_53_8]|uniref:Uncharacterized protein n=2 Tax=Candidatus Kaiseribacteriota TaxID=1752734 RepID=A0A1F6CXZ2_9BACT|nr:MAG: hypothetical protein A2851_03430 [Candidatus Kaiserbacteria bacterium RIFCSPHIGHO2_01_FULL_53_29]OGG92348.1 MAG: hypothetical protein A3H16_00255 [Candidatus Kaiserbacteria bacterium RIFCSPLOWO2_12_FULL_53_8]
MLEQPKKSVENLAEKATPKAFVADAAHMAIRELGHEHKWGTTNEDTIIAGINEAMVRYSPHEIPQSVDEWKRIAFISGEELIKDLELLGFEANDTIIDGYRAALDAYLKEIINTNNA